MRDVEFLAFPRLAAIAEIAWSPADGRAWDEFRRGSARRRRDGSALGINFYRSPQVAWER